MGMQHKGDKVFIFMEIAPKGSISSVISAYGSLAEVVVKKYTVQMLQGLAYLHSQDQPVIHRDIKGANVRHVVIGTLCKACREWRCKDLGCNSGDWQ